MSGVDAVFFYVGDIAAFSGLLLLGDKLRDFQAQVGIQRRQLLRDGVLGSKLN